MDLQIIGAGLSRTGTLSLRAALQILLDENCYHMIELFNIKNKKHLPIWAKACNQTDESQMKLSKEEWEMIFSGYKATVGLPSCYFFEELMKLNPEAKVILTIPHRDWFDSMDRTIIKANDTLLSFPMSLYVGFSPWKSLGQFCKQLDNKTSLVKHFKGNDRLAAKNEHEKWIEHVIEKVPQHKLLIYDIRSGWEPLCKFLNTPIPSKPFPQLNRRENFHKFILLLKFASYVFIICVPLITAVLTILYQQRINK